jgi:hypothetical protein
LNNPQTQYIFRFLFKPPHKGGFVFMIRISEGISGINFPFGLQKDAVKNISYTFTSYNLIIEPMFSLPEKQLLTDILNDYLNFDQRIVKDDELVLKLIQKFAVEKKISGLLTQQQVADEIGIDKRTLMKRINSITALEKELVSTRVLIKLCKRSCLITV